MKTRINVKEKIEQGITLIALVISIIVLLILAGVSITTLTGENGILNQANTAKQKTEKETAKEKVQIAVMGSYGNDGKLNYEELKENLDKVEGIIGVPNTIEKLPLDVYVDNYKVTIEEDGNVKIEEEKTENLPKPKPTTMEEAKEQGTVLDENNPTTIKDKYDNKIVVPEGFKIAEDSAQDATGGVVIEDVSTLKTRGSQFVWIPVGEIKGENGVTKTIELNRYTFSTDGTPTAQGENIIEDYFQELETSTYGNTVAKDIESFKTSVSQNGGYFIGRYEAGEPTAKGDRMSTSTKTETPVCKQEQYVYNFVTQLEASTLSRDMYQNKKFTSDLVNSYAWDTAIVFIQKFSEDENYSRQTRLQSSLAKTGKATDRINRDIRCNIYDMAGNCYEWTTETASFANFYCVGRGGNYNNGDYYTSCRTSNLTDHSYSYISFRPILYL